MTNALLERPRRVPSWAEEIAEVLDAPGALWEPLEPAPYLLAPRPWPRGAFIIDPEAQADSP